MCDRLHAIGARRLLLRLVIGIDEVDDDLAVRRCRVFRE